MTRKLVYGVGTYSAGSSVCWADGRHTAEYNMWVSMLERCYSKKCQERYPAYAGCSASAEFLDFQCFVSWAKNQVGFGLRGYQLDKDILSKGNKVYSAETCVFVPKDLNCLLVNKRAARGDLPLGVSLFKRTGQYRAEVNEGPNNRRYLGYFANREDAFYAYKEAKESFIRRQASKYVGAVDVRVYDALMSYTISVED